MSLRIQPAVPPFDPEVTEVIDRAMKGRPPLRLFSTLARDPRLCKKFFAGGLLDRGNLTLRQREIVIDRTTARCRSEYEWGVHVAIFSGPAGLTEEQVTSTASGSAADACWSAEYRLLIRLCDALHDECCVADDLWSELRSIFPENALIEILMLAGFYRTVSYLTNAMELPLEDVGIRFPS
jgi:alkylhydroperoxidase family enzyme